jgi:hypothetical protein
MKFFVHRYDAENLHHDALVRISWNSFLLFVQNALNYLNGTYIW